MAIVRGRCKNCGLLVNTKILSKLGGVCRGCRKRPTRARNSVLIWLVGALVPVALCWLTEAKIDAALANETNLYMNPIVGAIYKKYDVFGLRIAAGIAVTFCFWAAIFFGNDWWKIRKQLRQSLETEKMPGDSA